LSRLANNERSGSTDIHDIIGADIPPFFDKMSTQMNKILSASAFLAVTYAQGTVPVFHHQVGTTNFTFAGGATTSIPAVVVPVRLTFQSSKRTLDPSASVPSIVASPIFTPYAFQGSSTKAQYSDALMRAAIKSGNADWHTTLSSKPEVTAAIEVTVPVGFGYLLTSAKNGGHSVAIADLEFIQKEIFKQVPHRDGALIIAVTENTAFYALGDATVCCAWGTHGVDTATGNSFVLASYLKNAPTVVEDQDIQPLSQQLAEFFLDPLHDPLLHTGRNAPAPGNSVPSWSRPGDVGGCGGRGIASTYFLLEPTDTNPKNNFPRSAAFVATSRGMNYHLQNIALPSWYTGDAGAVYSFPDARALMAPAKPCGGGGGRGANRGGPTVAAIPQSGKPNDHKLIGYWAGYGAAGSTFPLRDVSPQWDVVIVAFATPDKNAPEGTMRFHTPAGLDTEAFKADIQFLKSQGRKVMISLGGGGQHFTLADPKRVPNFVSSVTQIVSEYGFDGIDIDFESPSLSIEPGDTDFRHPTTPSIVNLIAAMRQLHDHFGSSFMLSLVPEGTQIPSGYPSYGGQFGSYLAITWSIRDILSFIDVQDYNTPPLEGLDGEIYQPGTVDYHAAMTELLLHGFAVGGDPKHMFPGMPAHQVAVGFLTGDTNPEIVTQAMDYIITGKAPAGTKYHLRQPGGYPGMIGAMFWTIDADRRGNYNFSNRVGPALHAYPPTGH
jgi:chitinase